ncbi:hypothetical protein PPL_01608 [Heterostelium album PN500]|uniref:Uncharacterized protein n=1 Tax=Heterostelium pallidum (strain ATCC 26659 / Pp 5 / PN500) TaxID=670386 RepID=D3AZZ4_HETP5|nr:hypothetical protein PPL_01608 [Heterostelium album PN500]EFA84618.1 hypothetical protein PPL_01608 [Heterostelium album PN500]|eukprot:XP_020436731.1 hypothetical protein PPL_01608 [Heterostelium album PN500]
MGERTPSSLTGNHTFDILVSTALALRITISMAIATMCSAQAIFEIRYQRQNLTNLLNPRFMTLQGLIFFNLFRLLYAVFQFKTNSDATGSICDYLGMTALFFEMCAWGMIGSYCK